MNGISRQLEVDLPGDLSDEATGWGLARTGRVDLAHNDWIAAGATYGEGLGRYLLGIRRTAGGALPGPISAPG